MICRSAGLPLVLSQSATHIEDMFRSLWHKMSVSVWYAVICRSDTANEDAALFPELFHPYGGSSAAHSSQHSGSLPCGLGKCDGHHACGKPVG